MPHSLGVGHGRTLSRRVLLVVGLSVSIVLVVGGLTLLLLLQGASFETNSPSELLKRIATRL